MLTGLHVLIVDSDIPFREWLSQILADRGCLVQCAETDAQAMELLRSMGPDFLFLGTGDPQAFLTQAKSAMTTAHCKVIVLADQGDVSAAYEAWKLGAFDYICKPLDAEPLISRLRAAKFRSLSPEREKQAFEVMIPIQNYTCVQASCTVRDGIEQLKHASENFVSLGLTMEVGHRAVLVFDGEELVGVLTMKNLIEAMRPDYVALPSGAPPRSMRYSPMFWTDVFTSKVAELQSKCVAEIMNPRPPIVHYQANLMQVVQLLCEANRRRVAVAQDGKIIGVIREQELFSQISRQILG